MVWLIAMLGCPRPVASDFESAKVEATRRTSKVPSDWKPDAVLHLGHGMLDKLILELLEHYGTLEDDVYAGVATLHPSLTVKEVRLGEGACEDCLGVTTKLTGTLGVDTALGDTEVPLVVDVLFDAKVTVDRNAGGWGLNLQPRSLRDLDVTVSGLGLGYATQPVRQWLDTNLLADVPPQELTTLGGDDLPLRSVRVVPRPKALQVQLLTVLPKAKPVAIVDAAPEGWRLDVSPSTLTGMAAAVAYEQGPLERDIVPTPTSLALDGDRFTLGLRLWRVSGKGWWRDYEVTGRVTVERGRFHFEPESAKKVRASRGAALADPLAALGRGVILKAIEEALATTLPATHRDDAEGLRTRVTARSISGRPGRITAEGDMVVRPLEEVGKRRKRLRRKAKWKRR